MGRSLGPIITRKGAGGPLVVRQYTCLAIQRVGASFLGGWRGGKFTFSKIKSQFLHIRIRSLIPFQVQINNKIKMMTRTVLHNSHFFPKNSNFPSDFLKSLLIGQIPGMPQFLNLWDQWHGSCQVQFCCFFDKYVLIGCLFLTSIWAWLGLLESKQCCWSIPSFLKEI